MADLALFTDNFNLITLTQSINDMAVPSKFLSSLGLFSESPIETTIASVEKQNGQIVLVANVPRGSDIGTQMSGSVRGEPILITAAHLLATDYILADTIQNIRVFGSGSELEVLATKVAERLKVMRMSIDATVEYHRWGALNGKVLDADGTTVLLDVFAKFGLTKPANIIIDFADAAVDEQIMTATDVVDDALNGVGRSGFIALCGKEFNKKFHGSKAIKDDVRLLNDGQQARDDLRTAYRYKDIDFYRCNEKIANTLCVPGDEAILVPVGVDGMFQTRFAPADYNETVNTMGLPYYVKSDAKKYDKGFDFEAQSNPITWCSRPTAVRRLKLKAA